MLGKLILIFVAICSGFIAIFSTLSAAGIIVAGTYWTTFSISFGFFLAIGWLEKIHAQLKWQTDLQYETRKQTIPQPKTEPQKKSILDPDYGKPTIDLDLPKKPKSDWEHSKPSSVKQAIIMIVCIFFALFIIFIIGALMPSA